MIGHYTLCFSCVTFLICGLCLTAQTDTNTIKRVDAIYVPVIRLNDESQESLSKLWRKFKASPSLEYKRVIGALITDRPNKAISDTIDRDICALFAKEPIVELALLLGMCSSDDSRNLLEQFVDASDPELSSACRLALARRGDKAAETFFLKRHEQEVKRLAEITDESQKDAFVTSLRNIEYIGSAECIIMIFDCVGLDALNIGRDAGVTSDTATNMRTFLDEIGISVPLNLNQKDFARWWDENRDAVGDTLRKKEFLPRLKRSRIIKGSQPAKTENSHTPGAEEQDQSR